MKLLIVTQKVDRNDSVLGFFHRWIQEFAKHVEFVTVICLYKGEYDLPANVRVLSLGKETGMSRLKYISRFYRYIWEERKNYDSVFVHMNQVYILLGGLLWRILGKKIGLWYAHGHVSPSLRVATLLTNLVFTSTSGGFRIETKKKNIVGQGIDTELFCPADDSRNLDVFRIITVGRISPVKDYETLINAIDLLEDKKDIEVLVVGRPETEENKVYFEDIQALVSEKGLDHIFSFLGAKTQEEVAELLKKSDLFVNMSHTGSLDKAILEAMATGVPVLTCNEAVLDLLSTNKSPLFFEGGNTSDLASKIETERTPRDEKGSKLNIQLSTLVVNNHSIGSLIAKIIFAYK